MMLRKLFRPRNTAKSVAQTLINGFEDGTVVLERDVSASNKSVGLLDSNNSKTVNYSLQAKHLEEQYADQTIRDNLSSLKNHAKNSFTRKLRRLISVYPLLLFAIFVLLPLIANFFSPGRAPVAVNHLWEPYLHSPQTTPGNWKYLLKKCPNGFSHCDISGSDLAGVDLTGVDLSETDLRNVILVRANLNEANLSGTNLSGTTLSGAMLVGANLNEADLSNVILFRANLSDAKSWTDEQLSQAILCNTKLPAGSKLDPNRDCLK